MLHIKYPSLMIKNKMILVLNFVIIKRKIKKLDL